MVMLHINLKEARYAAAWLEIFCRRIPRADPWNGVSWSKFKFFRVWSMKHIRLKGLTKCSYMVATFLPTDPPPIPALHQQHTQSHPHTPTLGLVSVVQISIFSEHGQVAYQTKVITKCSNMVGNILPPNPPPPSTLGMGSVLSKFNIFIIFSCCITY